MAETRLPDGSSSPPTRSDTGTAATSGLSNSSPRSRRKSSSAPPLTARTTSFSVPPSDFLTRPRSSIGSVQNATARRSEIGRVSDVRGAAASCRQVDSAGWGGSAPGARPARVRVAAVLIRSMSCAKSSAIAANQDQTGGSV